MTLRIGENIRQLRRERDITQEELAQILGVTYQSVSRWENGSCYPDVELIPAIAGFFGITTDKLMGVSEAAEQARVEELAENYQAALSQGEVYQCIDIARMGIQEYPGNYTLLDMLMYALFLSGDKDGNIPEWRENLEKYDAEIVELGERIIRYCPDLGIRLEATVTLAIHHCTVGRKRQGRTLLETLPSIRWCREAHIWWGLEDEERLPRMQRNMRNAYSIMMGAMYNIISARLLPDEDLIRLFEKKAELDRLLTDGDSPRNTWDNARDDCHMAAAYARLGRTEESISALWKAFSGVKAFDARPEAEHYDSLLLGPYTQYRKEYETTDTRPLREIMRDKWLADSDFDPLRERPELREIIAALSEA